jgi:hypothetical protein
MIDGKRRAASIGGYDIKLDPLEFFYYYFFAGLRQEGKTASFALRSFVDFWHTVRDTYPAVPNQESTAREVHLLRRLVDTYAIRKSEEYGKANYAIQLSPEKIEILSPIV